MDKLQEFEKDLMKIIKKHELDLLIEKDAVIISHTITVMLGALKTFSKND